MDTRVFSILAVFIYFVWLLDYSLLTRHKEPEVLGNRLVTSQTSCVLEGGKVTQCQLTKGSTLDNVVQEWYDMYMNGDCDE